MTNNILKGPKVGEFNFCRLAFHTLLVFIKCIVLYQNSAFSIYSDVLFKSILGRCGTLEFEKFWFEKKKKL